MATVSLFVTARAAVLLPVEANMANVIQNDWRRYCSRDMTGRTAAKRIELNGNSADGF